MFKLNAQGVQEQVPTVNTFIRSHTGMQDAGNQAAHIAQDAGDAIAKDAQDAGTGIADGGGHAAKHRHEPLPQTLGIG